MKVESLFVSAETSKEALRLDKERFMAALTRVTGPFLQVAEHALKPLVEFAEPVSRDAGTGLGELVPQVYQRNQVKFGNPVGAVSTRYLRPEHPVDLPLE